MTIYVASDLTKSVPGIDAGAIHFGTLNQAVNMPAAVAPAQGDLLRPCKLPSGVKVAALLLNVRSVFGTTFPVALGFSNINTTTPSTAVYPSPSTQFAPVVSLAVLGVQVIMPQAGVWVTPTDVYVEALVGVVSGSLTTGIADVTVLSEFVGTK